MRLTLGYSFNDKKNTTGFEEQSTSNRFKHRIEIQCIVQQQHQCEIFFEQYWM
jgi:hypothetical protein